MNIVNFLYRMKINKFTEFKKFWIVKLSKTSFGNIRKDWLRRFTVHFEFDCEMVTNIIGCYGLCAVLF